MMLTLLLAICTLDVKMPAGPVRPEHQVHTVVLHHTAIPTMGDSLRTLRRRGMSYHYLIDEVGNVILAVPFTRTAFHAAGANKTAIGIAFAGGATREWAPTEKQRSAAKELIARLVEQHPNLQYLIGHGDIRDTNAGEPYGLDMAAFAAETGLHYLGRDEHPLVDYRHAAMELFVSPRTPRKPKKSQRWPVTEDVTCPTGPAHIRYKVTTIGTGTP
jgi:hypothetical protein